MTPGLAKNKVRHFIFRLFLTGQSIGGTNCVIFQVKYKNLNEQFIFGYFGKFRNGRFNYLVTFMPLRCVIAPWGKTTTKFYWF
jgi:hypothetical protein